MPDKSAAGIGIPPLSLPIWQNLLFVRVCVIPHAHRACTHQVPGLPLCTCGTRWRKGAVGMPVSPLQGCLWGASTKCPRPGAARERGGDAPPPGKMITGDFYHYFYSAFNSPFLQKSKEYERKRKKCAMSN